MITKRTAISNRDVVHRNEVRSAYNTPSGIRELARLLVDTGMFREIGPNEVQLRNFGVLKMEELGFFDIEMIERMFVWLFQQPLVLRPTIEEMGSHIENDL